MYIQINIEGNNPLIYSIITGQKKDDAYSCQLFETVEDSSQMKYSKKNSNKC